MSRTIEGTTVYGGRVLPGIKIIGRIGNTHRQRHALAEQNGPTPYTEIVWRRAAAKTLSELAIGPDIEQVPVTGLGGKLLINPMDGHAIFWQ